MTENIVFPNMISRVFVFLKTLTTYTLKNIHEDKDTVAIISNTLICSGVQTKQKNLR